LVARLFSVQLTTNKKFGDRPEIAEQIWQVVKPNLPKDISQKAKVILS
jgi:hypothetical protein